MCCGRRQLAMVTVVGLALSTGLVAAAPTPCVANLDGIWSDGDLLDTIGACKVCAADGTRCEQCWEFFSFDSKGNCVPCEATETGTGTALACMSCKGDDPSFCLDCGGRFLLREDWDDWEGFYADASGKCLQCPTPDCFECRSLTGACVQCRPGYGLVDGACRQCKQGASAEQVDADGSVTIADPLCENCDGDVNVCKRCQAGWWFDPAAAECVQCTANCARCESADDCSECDSGSFKDSAARKCVQCPQNCQQCTALNQCSECADGHTNATTDGSACAACTDTMCSQCAEGVDKCTMCSEQGFAPDPATQRCVACTPPNCANCRESAAVCTDCGSGFLLDGATGACVPCKVPNCSVCRMSDKTGQEECQACINGFTASVANANPVTACVPGAA